MKKKREKVFRKDDDLAVILHSNTKQTTLKKMKKHECPVCGATEWKTQPKIVIREGKTHVVSEVLICAKCGHKEGR